MRAALPLLLILLLLAACGEQEADPRPQAPVSPRAAVLIEPPQVGVGEVVSVEVAVVTPPGYRVEPVRAPASVAGLWLLDAESLAPELHGARQIQRTRFRVRPHETGPVEWPALDVEIEDPHGVPATLRTAPRTLEVVSQLALHPERDQPFSYRLPAVSREAFPPLASAAAGSLVTLLALGGIALLRRARRQARARALERARIAAEQPWVEALAALAEARALAATDWRRSSGIGARALKRYATRRYPLPIAARTPEEIERLPAPPLLEARLHSALACLRALDADRFREQPNAEASIRVRAALDEAESWVRSSMPAELRP